MQSFMTICAAIGISGAALAQTVSPFTEDFEDGLGGWDAAGGLALTLGSEGGNSFASLSGTVPTSPFGGATFFAGEASGGVAGFSGGAFVGDYVAGNITTLSFDVRHNAETSLDFSVRLPTFNNTPANIVFGPSVEASGEFTTLTFDISPDNPALIPTGGSPFVTASAIQNVQLLVGGIDAGDVAATIDIDNVAITPAPSGAVALLAAGGLAVRRRRG